MAEFSFKGLDEFSLSMKEIAELPEEIEIAMLNAQADVVVEAQRKTVKAMGIYDRRSTVHVADSIKKGKVKLRKGQRVIYVSPTGLRTRGKEKKQKVTNAEILFINEFGKRGQPARPAIKTANESSAEAATQAAFRVYDDWLKSKNL